MRYTYSPANYRVRKSLEKLIKKEGRYINNDSDFIPLLEKMDQKNNENTLSMGKYVIVHQLATNKAALWFAPSVSLYSHLILK